MFLSAIGLALLVGALAGGGLPRLTTLRLKWAWALLPALGLRAAAMLLKQSDPDTTLPLGFAFVGAYTLIFAWLWANWRVPGLGVAAIGIGLNTLAVLLNSGQMPIWSAAFHAAGFTPGDLARDPFHFLLTTTTTADFVARGGIFGDVVPIPFEPLRDVVSIGDLLLALGIGWVIVYAMTRPDAYRRGALFGGPRPAEPFRGAEATSGAVVLPADHADFPFFTLARNRNFVLLWIGQLVSFFGDRVHQVALGVLVLQRGTPLDVGLVFAATAVPNVLLGPLAGALVDRWDRRITMIACDLGRAVLVALVPLAIEVHIAVVYAIAFAVATVGLLFRPAKNAVVPQVVNDDQLVTANSAASLNETLADLIGYPVAAILVASLASMIAVAFYLDAATYAVSAALLAIMVVPKLPLGGAPFRIRAILGEMAEGWRFLIHQSELLTNTLVSTVAQLAFGAEIVCSLIYAQKVLDTSVLPFPQNYGWLMASLGLGSVVGGLVIGWIGTHAPKGPMTIAGFLGLGAAMVGAGLTRDPRLAIGLFFVIGVANMLYLVPTITLFQERTPQRLFGRVVSTRQALTFGAMAISMGVAGWMAGFLGADVVLMLGGGLIVFAGLIGLLVPSMRNVR